MKYINISKEIIETIPEHIASSREDFEKGYYIELTDDIIDALKDENFDILDYAFPISDMSVYVTYASKNKIIKVKNGIPSNFKIGTTIEDFEAGMYIPLTPEQMVWYEEHPEATPIEVLKMAYDINIQKQKKLAALLEYDTHEEVNSFIINGVIDWLTVPERTNYNTSITAAELLGKNEVTFLIDGKVLTVPTTQAKTMLAAVQLYADECYIITQRHRLNIESLDNIEDIMNYDFTQGYPKKLNFNII